MFAAFLTTFFFSVSAVTATRLTKFFASAEANLWRLLVATMFLGVFSHTVGIGLSGAAMPMFFFSGIIGFGVGDVALFQAYARIGSRLTIMLAQCLAAPIAALIEWVWLGTTLTMPELLASATILIGVGVALAPDKAANIDRTHLLSGTLWGILAAFGQGYGAVISRRAYEIAEVNDYSIDGINAAYQRIIGGVLICVVLIAWRALRGRSASGSPAEHRTPLLDRLRGAAPLIIMNGLSGPALGVSCYQWALHTTPTGTVLPIVALAPLVVAILTRIFEGEKPSRKSLLGSAVAVGGVALMKITQTG